MDRVKAKLMVVNAFTPRGGTQLFDPNDKNAEPEPTGDPPLSVQQQAFTQPIRQGSFHSPGQPWTPTPAFQQPPVPQHQYNYFAATQNYQETGQNYHGSQLPPHAQRGWSESAQPYSPQEAQPPQTPTNQTSYAQPPHNYANSSSSYDSQYPQYSHSIHSSPPLQASSVPPHANVDLHSSPQHQDSYPPQQSFQRSQTEPQPGPSYAPQFSGQPWPRTPAPDHNCDQYKYTYVHGLVI
jgi:hypothetical protein